MGVGLTMLSLTAAQKKMVEKAKAGPFDPFASEWPTFYRLKQAGVMQYVTVKTVELTGDAKRHLNL